MGTSRTFQIRFNLATWVYLSPRIARTFIAGITLLNSLSGAFAAETLTLETRQLVAVANFSRQAIEIAFEADLHDASERVPQNSFASEALDLLSIGQAELEIAESFQLSASARKSLIEKTTHISQYLSWLSDQGASQEYFTTTLEIKADALLKLSKTREALQYLEIASLYDPNRAHVKIEPYVTLDEEEKLKEILATYSRMDVIQSKNLEGCYKASNFARGSISYYNRLMNQANIDLPISEAEELWEEAAPYREQALDAFEIIFSEIDHEDILCGKSNFRDLMTYSEYLAPSSKVKAREKARYAYLAWQNYLEKVLEFGDRESRIAFLDRARIIPFQYQFHCSAWLEAEQNFGSEHLQDGYFDFYREQCRSDFLLISELSSVDSADFQILDGMARAYASEPLRQIMEEKRHLESRLFQVEQRLLSDNLITVSTTINERSNITNQLKNLSEAIASTNTVGQPSLIRLNQIQDLMRPREALFFINDKVDFVSENALVSVVTQDSFESYEIGWFYLLNYIQYVRQSLALDNAGRPMRDFAYEQAYWLWDEIFEPADLLKGDKIDKIIFVTTGFMDQLPLSLLISEDPDKRGFFSDYAWAYQDYSFQRMPSVRAFVQSRLSPNSSNNANNFLGIGDPLFTRGSSTIRAVTPANEDSTDAVHSMLAPLPNTRIELELLGSYFNSDPFPKLLLGAKATEAAVSGLDFSNFSTIAFATHAIIPGQIPGINEAALALSYADDGKDGLLSVSEIVKLNLNAELIILSACDTYTEEAGREGVLTSLSAAFLAAGSKSILATHWPVESRATAFLTTSFMKNYNNNRSEGLYSALRVAINGARMTFESDHPAYWAPFSVVGGL